MKQMIQNVLMALLFLVFMPQITYAETYDKGCWGDITIKYGETRPLSHQFSSLNSSKIKNWKWYIRTGNNLEELTDDYSIRITSQSDGNCTIKGVEMNVHIFPSKLYCRLTYGSSGNINE